MIDELTQLSAAFVAYAYEVARDQKPKASKLEIEGLAFRVLTAALDNYNRNEQLQNSSTIEGEEGTQTESGQVQGTGETRRIQESTEGIRIEPGSTTKSGAKKRRKSK